MYHLGENVINVIMTKTDQLFICYQTKTVIIDLATGREKRIAFEHKSRRINCIYFPATKMICVLLNTGSTTIG